MKLTNTQWIIVAVVAAIAIWYFATLSKRKNIELTAPKESGYIGQPLDRRATWRFPQNLESGFNIDGANAWVANCLQQYLSSLMAPPDDTEYQLLSEQCMSEYNKRKGGTAIKANKSINQ